MADVVKRLNYFDHQFLRAPDFNDEQNYHVSMRRRHNSLLHAWGIAQGLNVTPAGGSSPTAVTVSAGVALDSLGQEIVLSADTNIELSGESVGSTVYITIAYSESQSDPTSEAGGAGNTRWTEQPTISHSAQVPAKPDITLILAKLPRTQAGLGPLDLSDRRKAGTVGMDDITVNSLTLKGPSAQASPKLTSDNNGQANLNTGLIVNGNATINGNLGANSLSIQGAAAVQKDVTAGGNISGNNADFQGTLTARKDLYVLGNLLPTDANFKGTITVQKDVNAVGNVSGKDANFAGIITCDHIVQKNPGTTGGTTPTPNLIQKDVPGALGPILTIANAGGGVGAAGAIDFRTYDAAGPNLPPLRIESIDAGSFSNHLVFFSKQPGNAANPLQERARITSTGNLGIGTADPTAKLEIVGTEWDQHLKLTNTAEQGAGPGIYFTAAKRNWAIVATNTQATASEQQLGFYDATARAYRMVIDNNGNVGFGSIAANIPNPNRNLTIYNPGSVNGVYANLKNDQHEILVGVDNTAIVSAMTASDLQLRTNNAARVVIAANTGNLTATGQAFKPGGGPWGSASDLNLKKDVSTLEDALAKLLALRGVSFEWKNPENHGNLTGPQMGLVAQEVEKVFPEWVGQDLDGTKTLSIRGFEALTIEAFREIKQEINALKNAVAAIAAKPGLEEKEQKTTEKPAKPSARKSDGSQKK